MSVALGVSTMHSGCAILSVARLALPNYSKLSHKSAEFSGILLLNICLDLLIKFCMKNLSF